MNMRRIQGFTLIELLIVVAIIGILAAIAVPNFIAARTRAMIGRVYSDFDTLSKALEMYYLDHNAYPQDYDQNEFNDGYQFGLCFLTHPVAYVGALPTDPFVLPGGKNQWLPSNPFAHSGSDEISAVYEYGTNNDRTKTGRPWNYIANSVGPSYMDIGTDNDSGADGYHTITFDASNGLTSLGQIVLIGGSWSTGALLINNRRYGSLWGSSFSGDLASQNGILIK